MKLYDKVLLAREVQREREAYIEEMVERRLNGFAEMSFSAWKRTRAPRTRLFAELLAKRA